MDSLRRKVKDWVLAARLGTVRRLVGRPDGGDPHLLPRVHRP
jgi:hypothetical protein